MEKLFRRILLQRAIPQYLIFDMLGGVWALYFVWQHQVIFALKYGSKTVHQYKH